MKFANRARACAAAAIDLAPEDGARLIELHDEYLATGMAPMQAAREAAAKLAAELRTEAAELSVLVAAMNAPVAIAAEPEPQAAPAPKEPAAPESTPPTEAAAANDDGERKFYVTMVRDERVARLAGPFDTKEQAEAMVDRARAAANEADPRSWFDAFGVSAITSKNHRPGTLNAALGIEQAAQAAPAQAQATEAPAEAPAESAAEPVQETQGEAPETPAAQPEPEPVESEAAEQPEAKPGKVENFGEALPPSRRTRGVALLMQDSTTDADIIAQPFSKLWPADDVAKIEDTFTAAVAHTARAMVPAKPRKPYALKRWVETVKVVRNIARYLQDGTVSREFFAEKMKELPRLEASFMPKVALLEQLDRAQWGRIGKVSEMPDAYRYEEGGAKTPTPLVQVEIDDRSSSFYDAGSVADAVERVKEKLGVETAEKKMKFEVRGSGTRWAIYKAGDARYRPVKDGFTTSKDALAFVNSDHQALLAGWEAIKARDNVTEADVRSLDNRPRTGADHRGGKDATAEQFLSTFGFKGVEFGKWVSQGKNDRERQGFINQAFDALMDLADIVGIPPAAISLNGTMGLAFGSRGSGRAAAHFEPNNLVINLTKTNGAGSLAHEWFHALDNYFARARNEGKEVPFTGNQNQYRDDNFITHKPERGFVHKSHASSAMSASRLEELRKQNPDSSYLRDFIPDPKHPEGVRPVVEKAFADLVKALDESPMTKRAMLIDKGKSGGYWSQTIERAARSFEGFVIGKMAAKGYENDFLANVTPIGEFVRDPGLYPYQTPDELVPVSKAFETLFDTVETREDDAGNVAMFSRTMGEQSPLLQALSDNDELFALPRLSGTTVPALAAELNPALKVKSMTPGPGHSERWRVTFPNGGFADISTRKPNPYGPTLYGYDLKDGQMVNQVLERPGENPEDVADTEDVILDASNMQTGQGGDQAYAIAGALAHNTERIFIGDPAGLSDVAVRRRSERMLSLALRYGTTDFLGPHPRQVTGSRVLKVPPLKWVYGDDEGNAERLIALNVKAVENAFPDLATVDFDITNAQFVNASTQAPIDRDRLAGRTNRLRAGGDAALGAAAAGSTTVERAAILRAVVRAAGREGAAGGRRDGVLARFAGLAGATRGRLDKLFSHGKPGKGIDLGLAQQLAQAFEDAGLNRVNVAASAADLPEARRKKLEAAGADGARGVYFPDTDDVWVIADQVSSAEEFTFVAVHEAFHRGLRKLFPESKDILRQMWRSNDALKQRTAKIMRELGVERDVAIEEALADMAGEGQAKTLTGWDKLLDMIRGWLGKLASAAGIDIQFTDAMIETFVAGVAGEGLRRAPPADFQDTQPMVHQFSRAAPAESAAFKAWFGKSKVVDDDGKPLVVYHGTTKDFTAFDAKKLGSNTDHSTAQLGFFFTADPKITGLFNEKIDMTVWPYQHGHMDGSTTMPVYLSIKKPKILTADYFRLMAKVGGRTGGPANAKLVTADVKALRDPSVLQRMFGDTYDGVLIKGDPTLADVMGAAEWAADTWVAFKPEQIKSAIGNRGTYDPASPDIRLSRAVSGMRSINQQAVRNTLADVFGSAGAKVSWWDKTLGTQYAKSQKHPELRQTFDAAQGYLEDISTLANRAANEAPGILPKLDTFRDLKNFGINDADAKAIAAPIFEGTLSWGRDEAGKPTPMDTLREKAAGLSADDKAQAMLRTRTLDDRVLRMWKGLPLEQYEAAIETRYEREMLSPGVVWTDAELRDRFKATPEQIKQYRQFHAAVGKSLDQVAAAEALRLLGDQVPAELRALAVDDPGRVREAIEAMLGDGDNDLWNSAADAFNKVERLKARGYAPLMRFGKFKVHVVDDAGETQFFALYETKQAANKAAREFAQDEEFKGMRIERGVMSQEQHALFAGVPVESLELFAEAVGADKSAMFQEWIKLTKNNRSALKRLIHRKGTAGFAEDVPRVLASFVTSNARLASGSLNLREASQAAEAIRSGDVKDEAVKLLEAVQKPQETAGVLRGLMFMNFIGGSIASAVVNITQPITMTLPYLSQFGGAAKAAARMLDAAKTAAGARIADKTLAAALERAEAEGIVSPQEIHHLQARAMATWGDNPWAKRAAFIWSAPFSLAEQWNRRVSFIAAYRTAQQEGKADPFAFAEKAVIETQGLYNKGNAPNLARSAPGALALQFKQYSIHYVEWLARMWNSGPEGKKAVLMALAMLMLFGGADGLPFADDIDDLADTLTQALGYDAGFKKGRREFIAKTLGLGDVAADVFSRGLSSVPGVPMDTSLRMGMGNLLPATGMLLRSTTDRSSGLLELAGPAGGMGKQYMDAAEKALAGNASGAAVAAMPVALQNVAKAVQMWTTGEARDTKDRKVMEADQVDGLMKFLGFNPSPIARESSRMGLVRRSEQLAKNVEGEIVEGWARAMADQDLPGIQAAKAKVAEWNADNPTTPITITPQQIRQRAAKMRQTREDRFVKTVAPERRAAVAGTL